MYPLPTLLEFIDNPMGKGSTAIPNRQLIKDDLTRRYNELKTKKKFNHKVYRDKDEYYFHISVPSESERDNDYDVVIHFTYDEFTEYKNDNFLKRYFIKFFSNCPSFTYTFAQTFDQVGFLIKSLADKYNNIVLNNEPVIRNPGQIISFEKSTYFACLYIQENFLSRSKMHLNQLSETYDKIKLSSTIRTTDKIEFQIKKAQKEVTERKRHQEEDEKKKKDSIVKRVIQKGVDKITGKDKKPAHIIKPKTKISSRRGSVKK